MGSYNMAEQLKIKLWGGGWAAHSREVWPKTKFWDFCPGHHFLFCRFLIWAMPCFLQKKWFRAMLEMRETVLYSLCHLVALLVPF